MATTLAQLRSKSRARYSRSANSSEPRTALLDVYINYSLREIYNEIGDNAWFLRTTGTFTLNGPDAFTTMPPNVRRIYRIEDENLRPGRDIDFNLHRYEDDGSLTVTNEFPGTFTVHYLDIPLDLVGDADTMLLPDEHSELVVVGTCRRIAESVGNVAFVQSLMADYARLWKNLKRECLAHEGQRHEGLRSPYFQGTPGLSPTGFPWTRGW